jgi:uncharacterized SAM-binding protein YcdF (DUF218 family)
MLKTLKWLLIAVLIWLSVVSLSIWQFGKVDQAQAADCIIVLGAAINGDQPSPVFAERIHHAVHLYQQGLAEKIIFTGGLGEGEVYSESQVAQRYAQHLGIPLAAIAIEEQSHTTQQNLTEAAKIMQAQHLNSALIVSDPLHMRRALFIAHDQGIYALSSPTPTSKYQSLSSQLTFLRRELYFLHYYFFTGK